MAESYESKLKTVSIKYTSRASIQIRGNFFTVEACEERVLPEDAEEVDWKQERELLWNTVNGECDEQIAEIQDFFTKK